MDTTVKLKKLRQLLKDQKAYAFIVPTNDPFQNEYRAAHDERLGWLTGFDGSSGLGIITLERAAVFVDGRYTLQVQQQIDTRLIEGLSVNQRDTWIEANIPANAIVLYDPWLFSYAELRAWQIRSQNTHFELKPTTSNPIDLIWPHQPSYSTEPGFIHPIIYAGSSFFEKSKKLAFFLAENKADALLIGNSESLNWLLNLRGYDLEFTPILNMYGLFYKDGTIDIFCDKRKVTPNMRETLEPHVTFNDVNDCQTFFQNLTRKKKIIFDNAKTPVALIALINNKRNTLIPMTDPCLALRSVKNETELNGFRQSHFRDGVALVTFLAWIAEEGAKGYITEIDAADYLEKCRNQQDLFHGLSFPSIAGFGANGAIVHYRPTLESNALIKADNLLLVDSGAQYFDGTTDVTRTIVIGKPSAEQRDRFTRVLKGHIALAQAVFPYGTCGAQLDTLARQYLWQAGLDYNHGTGHGVGSFLNVHEGLHGISRAGSRVFLEPGMIISNEPGYYKENAYGIRIESLVAVVQISEKTLDEQAKLGFETLTMAPIDRYLIQMNLLTVDEIEWINSYHAHVYELLSPHVSQKTLQWLKHATSSL
ncbi:MAG: aminopeptidase P family protein [Candidatus Paracaedibacteraceae bacterium]|nr:aminopeptidase P family protein [Candidatus Paracaedibacteraceae bacterium]